MTERAWRDVKPGQRVELRGREYVVEKIKLDGKRARVRVRGSAGAFKSEVRAKDLVTVVESKKRGRGEATKPAPTRKAKPGPLSESPWDSQLDRVEALLANKLQARLVGEATDEAAGYYVPPVDLATIASHLALFHGADPSEWTDEVELLAEHERQHEAGALAVHHWHTETRPETGKKKGKKK